MWMVAAFWGTYQRSRTKLTRLAIRAGGGSWCTFECRHVSAPKVGTFFYDLVLGECCKAAKLRSRENRMHFQECLSSIDTAVP